MTLNVNVKKMMKIVNAVLLYVMMTMNVDVLFGRKTRSANVVIFNINNAIRLQIVNVLLNKKIWKKMMMKMKMKKMTVFNMTTI